MRTIAHTHSESASVDFGTLERSHLQAMLEYAETDVASASVYHLPELRTPPPPPKPKSIKSIKQRSDLPRRTKSLAPPAAAEQKAGGGRLSRFSAAVAGGMRRILMRKGHSDKGAASKVAVEK